MLWKAIALLSCYPRLGGGCSALDLQYAEWHVEPSPDGSGVAFESNDGGDREIFVLTKKGTADVSNHRAADWAPVWSPKGEWLAFESFRDGRRGIYRVFPQTARVLPVAVSNDADNWWPTWSPNGEWLVFVSNRTGDPELTKLWGGLTDEEKAYLIEKLDLRRVWDEERRTAEAKQAQPGMASSLADPLNVAPFLAKKIMGYPTD